MSKFFVHRWLYNVIQINRNYVFNVLNESLKCHKFKVTLSTYHRKHSTYKNYAIDVNIH